MREFVSAEVREQSAMILDTLEREKGLRASGVSRRSLMAVTAGVNCLDHFFLVVDGSLKGSVLWFAGEEIDRFESFDEYFASMILYVEETPAMIERDKQ